MLPKVHVLSNLHEHFPFQFKLSQSSLDWFVLAESFFSKARSRMAILLVLSVCVAPNGRRKFVQQLNELTSAMMTITYI